MQVDLYIAQSERGQFVHSCEAVIRGVGNATKSATETACKAILEASLAQVPRDTGALASTAWYHVEAAIQGNGRLSNSRYVGYVGYAGHERTAFQVNKTIASSDDYEPGGAYQQDFPRYTTKFKQFQGQHHPGGGKTRVKRGGRNRGYTKEGGYAGHGVQNAINPKSGMPVSTYGVIVHEDLDMRHPNGGKAKFLEDPLREYGATQFGTTLIHHWKYGIQWGYMYGDKAVWRTNSTVPMYFETSVVPGGSVSWKGDSL